MKRTHTSLLLGTATLTAALAAAITHLAGVELAYVLVIALAGFAVVLTAALIAFLPPEEGPRPVARPRPRSAPETTLQV